MNTCWIRLSRRWQAWADDPLAWEEDDWSKLRLVVGIGGNWQVPGMVTEDHWLENHFLHPETISFGLCLSHSWFSSQLSNSSFFSFAISLIPFQ